MPRRQIPIHELIDIKEIISRKRHPFAMSRILHQFLSVLLAISLGFFGVFSASSAAGSAALFPMVICADAGAETIWLDADGKPAEPEKSGCCNCDICHSAGPMILSAPVSGQLTVPFARLGDWPAPTITILSPQPAAPLPRGPPQMARITADGRKPAVSVPVARRIPVTLEFSQVQRGYFVTDRRANT